MKQTLLLELKQFITDLKQKEEATVYPIPSEIMSAIHKTKNLEKLLHDIFAVVNGSGDINISSIIRREFGMSKELTDHINQWARHSKEQFEDALHDAIDRAEIRAGKQSLFFGGAADKNEVTKALELLKDIAHLAVKRQLHPNIAGPDIYVEILDKLIQFYALPHTYPAGTMIDFRNLISSDRLYAMSGNNDAITAALKTRAKEWYQNSSYTFLESRESFHSYENVQYYLYALTEDQLERLRDDFIQYTEDEFKLVKAKPDLHKAKHLAIMLETVLRWKV